MIQKLKKHLLILASSAVLLLPLAVPATASAADIAGSVCGGAYNLSLSGGSSCTTKTDAGDTFNHIVTNVVNILSIIVGIVAVIMIIVGGLKFITSGGSQEGVASAKKTIMYALVGLIIVVLAQFIVHFVLGKAVGLGS